MGNESLLSKLDNHTISYLKQKKLLNSSINTILTYKNILNSFYEYILDLKDIDVLKDINREVILNFVNQDEKSANSTKILYLTVIKSFFIYIDEIENLNGFFELLFKKLTIKKDSVEVEALNEVEISKLLSRLEKRLTSFNKNRDALLIKIILFTGIRASEMLNIQLSDLTLLEDKKVYKIKILGKGDKERFVYIAENKISNELNFLLSQHYLTDYLAITNRKKRMTRVGLYNVISNKMKKALIDKKGVHILRHTFARQLVAKNINLSTISELLGHASITLTATTYAKSNEESKIRAIL